MRTTIRRMGLGLMILGLASASAQVVLASTPTRTVEEVHISGTFAAGARCPFGVVRAIDGTLVTTTFTVPTDSRTRRSATRTARSRYLNPANGKTLQAVLAGPGGLHRQRRRDHDPAHSRATPSSTPRQGSGSSSATPACIMATIDTSTGAILSIDFTAGHQDGTPFPALCVGLE